MSEMLNSGVELMIIGMGIVFLFLAMLIVVVDAMSKIVQHYQPTETSASPILPGTASASNSDASRTAAITAAVHQHRKRNQA